MQHLINIPTEGNNVIVDNRLVWLAVVANTVSLLDTATLHEYLNNNVLWNDTTPKLTVDRIQRIIKADLSYPIIFYNDYLIEGVHRLAKCYLLGVTHIQAVYLSNTQLEAIKNNEYSI